MTSCRRMISVIAEAAFSDLRTAGDALNEAKSLSREIDDADDVGDDDAEDDDELLEFWIGLISKSVCDFNSISTSTVPWPLTGTKGYVAKSFRF